MGGETIAAILAAAPWVREQGCLLLLQPMSAQSALRPWLQRQGYRIEREHLSREGDTLYTALQVRAGFMEALTPAEQWAGRQSRETADPLRLEYLTRLEARAARAVTGLRRSTRASDVPRLEALEAVHRGLAKMREEWITWQP